MNDIDWSSVKIFIAAPRELSQRRFVELVKHYLPKGNIVLGISREQYVVGFEQQPQFKMLQAQTIQPTIDKVNQSKSPNKIIVLEYPQSDLELVVKNLTSGQRVLLINGSWKYAFHNLPAYKILTANKVPIKFISPFIDEDEAKSYEEEHRSAITISYPAGSLDVMEMLALADRYAKTSYDYSFQTGASLGQKDDSGKYKPLTVASNKVIPYQTYALHFGNSREKHLSRPHDTNHYDTIHAEMGILVDALKHDIQLEGTTLFVNLLPCPNCARTLSQTDISEFVYRYDHSDGYAVKLLTLCGKKVTQLQ